VEAGAAEDGDHEEWEGQEEEDLSQAAADSKYLCGIGLLGVRRAGCAKSMWVREIQNNAGENLEDRCRCFDALPDE
jgi:hypothetical protein